MEGAEITQRRSGDTKVGFIVSRSLNTSLHDDTSAAYWGLLKSYFAGDKKCIYDIIWKVYREDTGRRTILRWAVKIEDLTFVPDLVGSVFGSMDHIKGR